MNSDKGVATTIAQPLGRKGAETRRRLLDGGRQLLTQVSAFELTPVAVSRTASLTSAGFYAYFDNIGEFLKQLVDEVTVAIEEADLSYLDNPTCLEEAIGKLVDQTYQFFTEHHPVLQYRNVLSERGNVQMLTQRARAALPRIGKLAALIKDDAPEGHASSGADRLAEAVYLNAGIESLVTTAQQQFDLENVISWQRLRDAQVRVVVSAIGRRSSIESRGRPQDLRHRQAAVPASR